MVSQNNGFNSTATKRWTGFARAERGARQMSWDRVRVSYVVIFLVDNPYPHKLETEIPCKCYTFNISTYLCEPAG